MLRRFIRYYRPYRKLFFMDMLAALLVSLIGILYPVITRTMLNDYVPNRKYQAIVIAGISLFVIYAIRALLNFFIQYQGHMMGVGMQADMRRELFTHLEKLPYSFYDNHETGKIMSRMTNDLMDVSELAHHGPENVIISSISLIAAFIYLSTINFWLTLIVFACVPFLLLIRLALRKKQRAAFRKSRESIAIINARLESSISGIRVTKAFDNASVEETKFDEGNRTFVSARQDAYKAMGQYHSATTFITDVFNVVILVAGGFFLYHADATNFNFGDYSAFVVSVGLFLSPVMTLINFMEQYQDGVTGFERFTEILDTPIEVNADGAEEIDRADGHIEFRHVTYSYDGSRDVLADVSLDIPKGSTYALVGPSGGGKTTICHLIPHFYDVTEGEILLDGKEIHQITFGSLRRNIGIVQQDIYLFNSSIRENIRYGKPGASDEEIEIAAKRANIHDFIVTLPNGYDTVIGERGVKLSGGQKQRLSIARVFLKNPPILILDEATSALDNTTEILIQQSLDELCKGRTTLVVAHRLSTVRNAEQIAVIDHGKIIEKGTHESLLAEKGVYADLYAGQFREKAQ